MLYEVRSKGTLIGHVDLGFGEMMPRDRVGSFRPNAAGKPLMVLFGDITRAHRAYRSGVKPSYDAGGTPTLPPEAESLYADVLATQNRVDGLELRLHRLDGSEVATEYITLRDLREVMVFNTVVADGDGTRPWEDSDWCPDCDNDEIVPDDERYHMVVVLQQPDAIP